MRKRLTNDDIDLILKRSSIKRIDPIIDTKTKILWKCLICEYMWKTKPNHILHSKSGCPKCKMQLKMTDDLIDEKISKNNIKIKRLESIGNRNCSTKILWRCLICEYEWVCNTSKIINSYRGCQRCRESKGEREIRKFLESNDIYFIVEKSFDDCKNPKSNRKLRFDFYLPVFNCCIEYDGLDHYNPTIDKKIQLPSRYNENKLQSQIYRDNLKNEYCKNKGISLVRIPYWDFKNIKNIIKLIIK